MRIHGKHINHEKKTQMITTTTTRPRSTAMNLFHEALSRARMRRPQNSEARRSARRVAIEARRQQARELGHLSQFGVR
jgi:hypothetical protein